MIAVNCSGTLFELSETTINKTTLNSAPTQLDRQPETMAMCFQYAKGYALELDKQSRLTRLHLLADAQFLGMSELAEQVQLALNDQLKLAVPKDVCAQQPSLSDSGSPAPCPESPRVPTDEQGWSIPMRSEPVDAEVLFSQSVPPFMAVHPLEALQGMFRRAPMRRPRVSVVDSDASESATPVPEAAPQPMPAAPVSESRPAPRSPEPTPVPTPPAEPKRRIPLVRQDEPTPQIRERFQKMEAFFNRY